MHCLVASIAVHDFVDVISQIADKTRFPCFHGEQLVIVDDDTGIEFGLLHFVLHGVAADRWATNHFTQLHHVEGRSAYRTAVGTLDPWRQACVVEVVFAW
jgi:hypothetical protein